MSGASERMSVAERASDASSAEKENELAVQADEQMAQYTFFRCVLASLYEGVSVRPSVGP